MVWSCQWYPVKPVDFFNNLKITFKELVANQEKIREEEALATRAIVRKPNNPKANLKNYDIEN